MFKEIYVKNFVLIDELHLDFTSGFSVFTGETGAGKSLLIDAISLLCGSRSSSEYVAQNKEFALVEGVFSLKANHPVQKILEELDIETDEEIIITRKITQDGKSSVRINQRSVSLSILRQVMSQMIDIHSQHDTQYLMNKQSHRVLLDEFCNEPSVFDACKEDYRRYKQALDDYEDCLNHDLNQEDLDYLNYQVNEIEAAQLDQQKIEKMEEELRILNQFEKLNLHFSKAYELLNGTDQVLEKLYESIHQMEAVNQFEWIEKLVSSMHDCYYQIEEHAAQINDHLSTMEYDEVRVNEINEYLFMVNNLKRKYGNSIDQILHKKEELALRIQRIENRQEVLDELKRKKDSAYHQFEQSAQKVSALRHKRAASLEKEIMKECRDLYLEKARFEVRFENCEANEHGLERIEFYVSMNPGEPPRPLCNVASGGELSRLMLGLKTIFTDLTSLETMIFDEIDTGVSGKVALAIGQKMRQIAISHQLFSITHLASVAACAQHHYVVEKVVQQASTTTHIRKLDKAQILQTLAMISSNSTSETALKAAEELYERAQAK